jgi:predicted transcriptional regulator
MATGAEALDVDVVGDVRIPGFGLGQTCNDKGCIKASGETLQATGEISLHGLRSDRGRPGGIQGEVNVKAGTARLDETPFDASLLSPFGAVAAVAVVGVGIALLALKVVAPFFTRIARPAALDHPNRRRIMDAITNSPGASFNGLRRMTGLASGTLRHHLSVLTSNRLVATKPFGTSVRHYPMDVASSAHHGLALLQDPASRRICDAIAGSPGLAQADILRRFNGEIPRSSVQFKLNRLVEAEILAIGVDGQRLQYGLGKRFPANPVAMALQSAG